MFRGTSWLLLLCTRPAAARRIYSAPSTVASFLHLGRFCYRPTVSSSAHRSQLSVSVSSDRPDLPLYLAVLWDDTTSADSCASSLPCYESKVASDKISNVYHGTPSNPTVEPSCGWRLDVARLRGDLFNLADHLERVQGLPNTATSAIDGDGGAGGLVSTSNNSTINNTDAAEASSPPGASSPPDAAVLPWLGSDAYGFITYPFYGKKRRAYYFAIASCKPAEIFPNATSFPLNSVRISITPQNSFPEDAPRSAPLVSYLSADEYDILTLVLWMCATAAVFTTVSIFSLARHYTAGTLHWLGVLLLTAQVLHTAAYGATATFYTDLGATGFEAGRSSRAAIVAVQVAAQTLTLLTSVLYTKGWVFGRNKISSRGRVLVACFTTAFGCFSAFAVLFSQAGLVVVSSDVSPLHSSPYSGEGAQWVVALRSTIAAWVLWVTLTTVHRNPRAKFGLIGLLTVAWLVAPLVVASAAAANPCFERPAVLLAEAVCTLALLAGLELALWPFSRELAHMRSLPTVKRANRKIGRCIRTCGTCCCKTNGSFGYVRRRRPLPQQTEKVRAELDRMFKDAQALALRLEAMLVAEGEEPEDHGINRSVLVREGTGSGGALDRIEGQRHSEAGGKGTALPAEAFSSSPQATPLGSAAQFGMFMGAFDRGAAASPGRGASLSGGAGLSLEARSSRAAGHGKADWNDYNNRHDMQTEIDVPQRSFALPAVPNRFSR